MFERREGLFSYLFRDSSLILHQNSTSVPFLSENRSAEPDTGSLHTGVPSPHTHAALGLDPCTLLPWYNSVAPCMGYLVKLVTEFRIFQMLSHFITHHPDPSSTLPTASDVLQYYKGVKLTVAGTTGFHNSNFCLNG